jgi:hypothetical protein
MPLDYTGNVPVVSPQFQFGLSAALPKGLTTAWGARLIFPCDLLHDRQSFPGLETPAGMRLQEWLNKGGALAKALATAKRMARNFQLSAEQSKQVILFEDETGIIVANPQSSYGYLYAAAWLKSEVKS